MKKLKAELDIAKYTTAIQAHPDDYRSYNNRGIAYLKLNMYEPSVSDFTKAIDLLPSYDIAYVNRGIAYQEMRVYDLSIADFSTAINLNPRSSMAYNNRGFCYILLGRLEEAEEDITRALEINGENIYALNSMAELHAAKHDPEQACVWLKKAIEKGYNHWSYLKSSPTYDPIRNEPCFKEVLSLIYRQHPK